MKLSEIIQHVVDENVLVQNLETSFTKCNYSERKKLSTITFKTDQMFLEKNVAIVVWIPRDKLPPKQQL